MATVVAPVLQALAKMDANVRADSQAPFVYARLTPSQILEISARADVSSVSEDGLNKPL